MKGLLSKPKDLEEMPRCSRWSQAEVYELERNPTRQVRDGSIQGMTGVAFRRTEHCSNPHDGSGLPTLIKYSNFHIIFHICQLGTRRKVRQAGVLALQ